MSVAFDQQIVRWVSGVPARRLGTDDLPSPRPLIATLPAIYQQDDFSRRFTAGLDEVIAPIFQALDCLEAYLDPMLAPPDFFEWLATWVGAEIDQHWSIEQRRVFVRGAAILYAKQGTPEGLSELVGLLVDGEVEVTDSGGVAWSQEAGTAFPGSAEPYVHIRLQVDDPASVDTVRVSEAVEAAAPAHVRHRLEVVLR